jgi:hypothetical protein
MRTKLFIDLEFTGLHQATTPISLGIISECGKTFYAEFTDYDRTQLNEWLDENIIPSLWVTKHDPITSMGEVVGESRWADKHVFGSSDYIKPFLEEWLSQFEEVIIWSDCLAMIGFYSIKFGNTLSTFLKTYTIYLWIFVHYSRLVILTLIFQERNTAKYKISKMKKQRNYTKILNRLSTTPCGTLL